MKYITVSLPAHIAEDATPALFLFEASLRTQAYEARKDDDQIIARIYRNLANTISKGRIILDNAIWNVDPSASCISVRIYLKDIQAIDDALTKADEYSNAIARANKELAVKHPGCYDEAIQKQAQTIRLTSDAILDAIADGIVSAGLNPLTISGVA